MTRARDLADFNLDGKAVTINESSADLDFRVESNGNANMLFVDAGNDRVGVGTASPSKTLHVSDGTFSYPARITSTGGTTIGLEFTNTGSGANPPVVGSKSDDIFFETSNTERVRILSSGGLTFNGDTAAANALDDYEEGEFTPAIWEGTSAISDAAYNTSFTRGKYIKIGRMVMITMSLRLTSKGTPTGSSSFRIGGFPFTTTNDVRNRSAFATYDHDATGIDTTGDTTGTLHAFISNGVNYLGFRVSDPSKAAAETLNYDDLGNDTYLQLTGTIVVD